jgi:hypothetical protein
MEIISTLLLFGILGGVVFGLGLALMGLCFLCTHRETKGLKYLGIGLLLPVALVFGPLYLASYFSRSHDASTNQVTLKGRVVDAAGVPVEGVTVNLYPCFTGSDSSELYNRYPHRETVSNPIGAYALTEVRPLDIRHSVYYLGSSNAAVRAQQFFFGQVTATRPPYSGYTEPQLTLPLISENRLKQARRTLFVYRLFGRGRPERADLCLPRSEGNVIFLPDITVANEAPKPLSEPASKTATPPQPPPPEISLERAVAGHRAAFKRRCDADKQTYGEELFREIEILYQSANKDLKSPSANGILKSLIEKYPKSNRAGCAAQYLGQHASGKEKENFLRAAIRDFSDCYYGSGVQVGAYARFYLGRHYMGKGMTKEAQALFDEVRRDYPDAVNHQGQLLVDFLPR